MILLANIAACTRRAKAPWGWKRGTLSGETMPREGSPSSWKSQCDKPEGQEGTYPGTVIRWQNKAVIGLGEGKSAFVPETDGAIEDVNGPPDSATFFNLGPG